MFWTRTLSQNKVAKKARRISKISPGHPSTLLRADDYANHKCALVLAVRKKGGKLQIWLQGVILNGSGLSHLLKSSCHLSKFAMATLS